MARSSWQTTSGLLDDYDQIFEEVWFGTDERIGDGKTCLLAVRGPALQDGEVVDEEHLTYYSCGDGWKPAKGGEEATHPQGKTAFGDQSNIGKLIDSVVALGDDVLETLAARGETYEAATWRGLKFHIERKQFSFKDRATGETRTYEVALPTAFLGVEGEDEKPKRVAKPSRRPAKRAKGSLRDEVAKFAAEFEDHGDFIDAVFDPDEFPRADDLQADEELSNEVLDPDSALWVDSREE